MLDIQYVIVALIVLAAIGYAIVVFARKTRSFSTKSGCADDCGCSTKSKTPKIAH